MSEIIGNAPGFNPTAARPRGLRRGKRFRWLLVGGGVVFTAGLILLPLLRPHWPVSEAKLEVKENTSAVPPPYKIEAALPVHAPEPVQAVAPPPPPKEQPVERPRSSRAAQQAKRELPQQIAWNVQVQGEPPSDWFVNGMRPMMAKGCALRPGASLIPAVLNTVVDSGVTPGQVIATVSEPVPNVDGVIDPETGEPKILIHQGTKMVGTYQNALQFGQLRLGIVWTEATMPDGTQITLADANGMDVAGSQGMGGEVQTKWGQIIAVAAIFTVFDAAQRATVPDNDSYSASLADASANQFSRVGTKAVQKILDSAITIRIPAGTQLTISPAKTIQVC